MKRSAILPALALVIIGLIWTPAHACSCALAEDPNDAFRRAHAVFEGRAVELTALGRLMPYRVEWRFDISAVKKGKVRDPALVRTESSESSCGAAFVAGTSYRVYARTVSDGVYETGLCDANTELGKDEVPPVRAAADAELERGLHPRTIKAAAIGGVLALVAAWVVFELRRRRRSET